MALDVRYRATSNISAIGCTFLLPGEVRGVTALSTSSSALLDVLWLLDGHDAGDAMLLISPLSDSCWKVEQRLA